jgi:TolB-like protein
MRSLFLSIFLILSFLVVNADEINKFSNNFEEIKIEEKTKNKSKAKVGEIEGIHKIAVLPFSDLTQKNREQAEMFSDKFASQLVQAQMFDVKYPKEAIAVILDLGITKDLAEFDSSLLVKLGKKLGVEALVIGEIKEINLYEPVRVSFSLKMFIVEKKSFGSSEDIWDLSSYGVPVESVNSKDKERFAKVWAPQNVYNASVITLRKDIKRYAQEHNFEGHAFGWEYVIQSNERFLEYICYDICEDLKVAVDPKYQKKDGLWYRLKAAFAR